MCLKELLHYGADELQRAGIVEYALDARLLLQFCAEKTRTEIFLQGDDEADYHVKERYLRFVERRKKREPVAYILGVQEFWSLPFYVSPDVLIPRAETEFLLDRVFALARPENFVRGKILDLCCGSGVIASVLVKETGKKIVAADISGAALEMTRKNTRRHKLDHLVELVRGDLLSCFLPDGSFSLIVANPPYVSSLEVVNDLEPEVSGYEPHLALDGGDDGLTIIEKIRHELPMVLCRGGECFMEIGADHGAVVKELFQKEIDGCPGFQCVDILKDYTGRDRVVRISASAVIE